MNNERNKDQPQRLEPEEEKEGKKPAVTEKKPRPQELIQEARDALAPKPKGKEPESEEKSTLGQLIADLFKRSQSSEKKAAAKAALGTYLASAPNAGQTPEEASAHRAAALRQIIEERRSRTKPEAITGLLQDEAVMAAAAVETQRQQQQISDYEAKDKAKKRLEEIRAKTLQEEGSAPSQEKKEQTGEEPEKQSPPEKEAEKKEATPAPEKVPARVKAIEDIPGVEPMEGGDLAQPGDEETPAELKAKEEKKRKKPAAGVAPKKVTAPASESKVEPASQPASAEAASAPLPAAEEKIAPAVERAAEENPPAENPLPPESPAEPPKPPEPPQPPEPPSPPEKGPSEPTPKKRETLSDSLKKARAGRDEEERKASRETLGDRVAFYLRTTDRNGRPLEESWREKNRRKFAADFAQAMYAGDLAGKAYEEPVIGLLASDEVRAKVSERLASGMVGDEAAKKQQAADTTSREISQLQSEVVDELVGKQRKNERTAARIADKAAENQKPQVRQVAEESLLDIEKSLAQIREATDGLYSLGERESRQKEQKRIADAAFAAVASGKADALSIVTPDLMALDNRMGYLAEELEEVSLTLKSARMAERAGRLLPGISPAAREEAKELIDKLAGAKASLEGKLKQMGNRLAAFGILAGRGAPEPAAAPEPTAPVAPEQPPTPPRRQAPLPETEFSRLSRERGEISGRLSRLSAERRTRPAVRDEIRRMEQKAEETEQLWERELNREAQRVDEALAASGRMPLNRILDDSLRRTGAAEKILALARAREAGDTLTTRSLREAIDTDLRSIRKEVLEVPGLEPQRLALEYLLDQRLEAVRRGLTSSYEEPELNQDRLDEELQRIMDLSITPEALERSPLWNSLLTRLAVSPAEMRRIFNARMDIYHYRRIVEGPGSDFSHFMTAAGLLSGEKFAILLRTKGIKEAYDSWERTAWSTPESGRILSGAKTPEEQKRLRRNIAMESLVRQHDPDAEGFVAGLRGLDQRDANRRIQERFEAITATMFPRLRETSLATERERMIAEATVYGEEARTIFFFMRAADLDKPPKDWWHLHHRLENYYSRLWGSGIGSPAVVEKTAGRVVYESYDPQEKTWQKFGHNLGMGIEGYSNGIFTDAFNKRGGIDDLGFVRSGERWVRFMGENVYAATIFTNNEGVKVWAIEYDQPNENNPAEMHRKYQVINVENARAATLEKIHQKYAGESTAKVRVVSTMKDAEALRKFFEDEGFFDSPPGAEWGSSFRSEILEKIGDLMKNVAHLDELGTSYEQWVTEQRNKTGRDPDPRLFPGRVPGKVYKEDLFYGYLNGLLDVIQDPEARQEFPGYRLAPNTNAAILVTEFANRKMITPDQAKKAEKRLGAFGTSLKPRLDLMLLWWRSPLFRTAVLMSMFWDLLKSLWSFGTSGEAPAGGGDKRRR